MSAWSSGQKKPRPPKTSRAVVARVIRGQASASEVRFTRTFMVGRSAECDLRLLDDSVAGNHLQIIFDGVLWWARDLDSPTGTFVNGSRIQIVSLPESAEVELGKGGPLLSLTVSKGERPRTGTLPAATEEPPTATGGFSSETEIIQRYLRPKGDKPAGRETMMFRAAFDLVQKRSSRRYQIVIGLVLLVLVGAGSVIAYQSNKLHALRSTAERLFYTTKSVELQIAKLEEIVLLHADPKQVAELMERRAKLKQMEKEYDAFVRELGVYAKVPEDERTILRVARIFGECEVNVPKGFVAEVRSYVKRWKSTDRLARILQRAKQKGYPPTIARTFTNSNLPPQYIYLALQESAFDERAVGPPTRYGFAKGMWQFISSTAHQYGLRIGPLHDQGVYDPKDERFNWEKATAAAARYIRDLNSTEAQASGLLVMASYNWGEDNVRSTIGKMPENPRDRNFWRLLAGKNVPGETYDYVLSIFSIAVICENPRLFGFDGECPLGGEGAVGMDGSGTEPAVPGR